MNFFDKLFGKKKTVQKQKTESKKIPAIDEFPQLDPSERMGLIMTLGDTGRSEFFSFIKYAIQIDTDINVKFAALKRIHLFKDHPDAIPMLKVLKDNGNGNKFEPYFSMALSRLGIITLKEFEDKINGVK